MTIHLRTRLPLALQAALDAVGLAFDELARIQYAAPWNRGRRGGS